MIFQYLKHIEFSQPAFFGLFLLLPVLLYWYVKQINGRTASMMVSSTAAHGLHSWRSAMRHVPFVFRLLCLSCIITALAKPQMRYEKLRSEGRGIDIILCIDVSGSMTAQDFSPNRLEAAKEVAIHFVQNRISDQIGVVIFSGESFTQCPPTTDYDMLISSISSIRNSVLQEGTAIGSGLATSIDRLRSSSSKSKIVVLLTDGENNGGFIDPKAAKEIAKAFGVKVYTIGVGTDGFARQPVKTDHGIEIKIEKVTIDEKLLTEIATETGGQYFRARDNAQLSGIYAQIDAMEKSEVQVIRSTRYAGKQIPFIAAAIFLLFAEIILRYILLRKFP